MKRQRFAIACALVVLIIIGFVVAFPAQAKVFWTRITWLATNRLVVWDTSLPAPASVSDGGLYVAGDAEVSGTLTSTTNVFTSMAVVSATIGGGYGSTGCTITDVGALSCDGATQLDNNVQITGTLDALGAISDSGGNLVLNDTVDVVTKLYDSGVGIAGALNVDDAVNITGSIFDGGGTLVLGDTTQITSTLDVLGAISDSGGDLILDDRVGISLPLYDTDGDLMLDDDVAIVGGSLYDSSIDLYLNDDVNISGSVYDAGGSLVLGDATQVTSTLDVLGAISDSAGDLVLNDTVDVVTRLYDSGAGIAGAINIDDTHINATGSIFDSGGTLVLGDATQITSTLDVLGAISDSAGILELNDDVALAGGYSSTGCSVTDTTGALICDGTVTAVAGMAATAGDITISPDAGGGNAGSKQEFIGLPRIRYYGVGAGTNGAAGGKTVGLDDDSPAGEFVATDVDVECINNTSFYREGAASLEVFISEDADTGDGCHDGVGPLDFSDDESIGFWMMCSPATDTGDMILDLTDDGGQRQSNLPAAMNTVWQWVEIALPGANADKDAISDISFEASAAGAAKAAIAEWGCYIDAVYKWDATEEDVLGNAILNDGVLGVVNAVTALPLVEYTDYFVHYQTGADAIVWITDQSAALLTLLYAY